MLFYNEMKRSAEPIGLNSSLSSSRRKNGVVKAKGIPSRNMGLDPTQGIKKRLTSHKEMEGSGFNIDVTEEEERRRKERQLRFASGGSSGTSGATAGSKRSIMDVVNGSLSAPRKQKDDSVNAKINPKKKKKRQTPGQSKSGGFVGTSQALEKPYLRLTDFPVAEDVRPLSVLKDCLQHIKLKFFREEDYDWANEQLKSLRQDLTVQGIRNDFVLEVYETHARIALEQGALTEFNQCQTMIYTLTTGFGTDHHGPQEDNNHDLEHARASEGSETILTQSKEAADEFGGYRLLYALIQKSSIVTRELANASRKGGEACQHAILVCKAVTHADYHAFFRLYESAPHLSAYLMDFLVQRVRVEGYKRIISAYRPSVSVEFFREALDFADLEETRTFLKGNKALFFEEKGSPPFWIDCKSSQSRQN